MYIPYIHHYLYIIASKTYTSKRQRRDLTGINLKESTTITTAEIGAGLLIESIA
jgi:hypothetical protein